MDRRTYELEQLRKLRELIAKKERLEKEREAALSRAVEATSQVRDAHRPQEWYRTDRGDRVKREVEGRFCEKQERTARILKILAIVGPIVAFYGGMIAMAIGVFEQDTAVKMILVGLLVTIGLPLIIRSAVLRKELVWNKKDLARLREAEKQDEQNAKHNQEKNAKRQEEADAKIQEINKRCEEECGKLVKQLLGCVNAIKEMDLLGPEEQNTYAVDRLIKIMESHRADTLPEALRIYDEQQARKGAIALAQFQERTRQLEEKWRRQEQFERDMAQAAHNSRMEKLAQDRNDELERKRKADDYYRRYGQPQ